LTDSAPLHSFVGRGAAIAAVSIQRIHSLFLDVSLPQLLGAGDTDSEAYLDELQLVERVRAGDSRAFDLVFSRYYKALCGYCESFLGNPAAAEDVVQDVFVKVWERRAAWRIPNTVRTYLFTAVRNLALDRLRHEGVRRKAHGWVSDATLSDGDRLPGMGHPALLPDAEVELIDLGHAVRAAVSALPPRCREAYVLRHDHALSYIEIAAIMSISPRTVETQLGIALRTLRERLEPYL
jgi:RNA polymerase sigma-70 factor (ECF subfamily)